MKNKTMTDEQKQHQRERIGQRVADLRKDAGMTQRQLGDACGLQNSHIARIEKGRYSVGFDTLQAIAEALGCTVDFIQMQKQ